MSIDYDDEKDYGGGDEVFEDTGSMYSDTDVSVLHDMERELEVLVKRYHVPSNELDNLLKVVMTMSEMMDHRREELEKVLEQKAELEELWNKEKDKWKLLHTRKLELECRYDEDRSKHENEKRRLESEKTQLETRTQQLNKLNAELLSEIQRLLVKADQDEKTRIVLREQYKREYELKRNASVRRKGTFRGRRPISDSNSFLRPGQSQLPSSASADQKGGGGLEDSMSYVVNSEKPTQAVKFSNTNEKQSGLEESGTFQGFQNSSKYTKGFSLHKEIHKIAKQKTNTKNAATKELSLERSGSPATQGQPAHSLSQERAAPDDHERSSRPSSIIMIVDPPSFTRSSSEDTERAVTPITPATPQIICPACTSLQDELMGGAESMALLDPCISLMDEQFNTNNVGSSQQSNVLESPETSKKGLEIQEAAQSLLGGSTETQESTQPMTTVALGGQESAQPADERSEEQESAQPADERSERSERSKEQKSSQPEDERSEKELVQSGCKIMEVQDEQKTAQPVTTGSPKLELQTESTEQLFRNEETAMNEHLHEQLGTSPVQPMNEQEMAQQEVTQKENQQAEQEIKYEETEDENQTFLESQSVGSDLDEPEVVAREREETEMLRKDKEAWKEETARLLLEKKYMREEKEELERQVAQLLLETTQMKGAEDELRRDLQDMKNERDEVLANYFDQTYNDHCITKKELFDVLKKLENTKMELEVVREEKNTPPKKKKSLFRRVGERMKNFRRKKRRDSPTTLSSPPALQGGQEMLTIRRPLPIQMSSLSEEVEQETVMNLTANHDWRVAQGSSVRLDQIPTWVEQFHLKGIETVHVDKIVIGKTYQASSTPSRLTRSRPTFSKTLGMPGTAGSQWCVEVWVATREGVSACIEIVDVLKKASTRVRQRFVVQQAKHIQCMKFIPGGVEQGDEPITEVAHPDPEIEHTNSAEYSHPARAQSRRHDSTMWIITDDNRLCIYPTTDPSHLLINSVHLFYKALCIECVAGKVLIGHADAIITVYTRSNDSPMWNIYSPGKQVSLVQLDPDGQQDVRCMTEVGTRLWVICGRWIYLLDREELISEGTIFLEDSSSTPDSIVSVGSYAAVLVNSSSINLYDAVSAALQKKLTIYSLFSTLAESSGASTAVYITAITADHQNIYVGTSNGKIIAVFLRGLMGPNARRNEAASALLNQTCVSTHSHREKIDSLVYIPLSLQQQQQDAHPQNEGSLPAYSSLVVSVGKGYQRHTDVKVEVEGEVQEEVDDRFQVMVWGRPIGR